MKAPEIFKKRLKDIRLDGVAQGRGSDFESSVIERLTLDYGLKGYTGAFQTDGEWVYGVAIPEQGIEPREYVYGLLREGFLEDSLPALEVLCEMLGDSESYYNYGLCLSELGRPEESIEPLRKAVDADPDNNHARVALGVAFTKLGRLEDAEGVLRDALMFDQADHWANRNLGAVYSKLGKFDAAIVHFRRALESKPNEAGAMLGLAEALEELGGDDLLEADRIYSGLIEALGDHPIAERAKEARTRIAGQNLRENVGGRFRMDAVSYMQHAIQMFSEWDKQKLGLTVFEIARLGESGLDINDSDKKYTLRTLEGKFSGLQLLCYMHVGLKLLEPDLDPQSGLDAEFEIAKELEG